MQIKIINYLELEGFRRLYNLTLEDPNLYLKYLMIFKEKNSNSSKKQSKKQKKMARNSEDKKCPLCLDVLELDDLQFYPCKCGYQVCRFCWHRIRTDENSLCPACRRQYTEDTVSYKPLSQEELLKVNREKKMKDIQKKKEVAESRKQLANVRVVQKNLVYVYGLPSGIETDEDKCKRLNHIFKEFGTVAKCVMNSRTNYAGSQNNRACAYVTYQRIEDALRAYKELPNIKVDEHEMKTSLGTTKYCSNFLKNVHCPKQVNIDCMYLHEMADEELSFTKEQIHAGEHLKCGDMLYNRMMANLALAKQKTLQNSVTKEPVIHEQEIEPEKPPLIENTDPKDNSKDIFESSNNPPTQSKLQLLFSKRDSQSMFFNEADHNNHHALNSRESRFNFGLSDEPVQQSLPENNSTVNNRSPVNNSSSVKSYQNFPQPSEGDLCDPWFLQRCSIIGQSHNNHLQHNGIHADIGLSGAGNSTSSILSRLPIGNNINGTSSIFSRNLESETEKYDDDLEFDPCQYSLCGLEDLMKAEAKSYPSSRAFPDQQKQQRLRNPQLQRQRNPPPGFPIGQPASSTSALPSPTFDGRGGFPNRMSLLNMSTSFNHLRQNNYQVPRFQSGISVNANSHLNGFSPQSIRNLSPQTIHEILSRSSPNVQHLPNQRMESLTPQSFEPNLSPSYWNIHPQQWPQTDNSFTNSRISSQTLTENMRPASPMNFRRMPPVRPVEYNNQVQQLTARYNNITFSDNPQLVFQNNQLNPLTKGVHTYP